MLARIRSLTSHVPSFQSLLPFAFVATPPRSLPAPMPKKSTTSAATSRHFSTKRTRSALKAEEVPDEDSPPQSTTTSASTSASTSATTSASTPSPKKKKKKAATPPPSKPLPIPSDFEELYSLVAELRSDNTAPVDTDGAEALALSSDPVTFRYQTLIALMLSSQTKDAMVGQAMRRMQAHPGGLTIANVAAMPSETLKELIYGVGFHNNKAKYIKAATDVCVSLGNDIPKTAEGLCDLPGVGPKMAHIVMSIAWGEVSGIGVDTHMHRMFNILGWVKR